MFKQTYLRKFRDLSPACIGDAAPAHAVTLAHDPHGLPHRHAARLVVVEVGRAHRGLTRVQVQELAADLLPEVEVVAAAAPLPIVRPGGAIKSLAAALGQPALAAVP